MVPPAQAEAPAFDTRDHAMMRLAMDQALNASLHGEVPVGAVLVKDGQVIATGYNHPVGSHDPSAHAEMRGTADGGRAAGAITGWVPRRFM